MKYQWIRHKAMSHKGERKKLYLKEYNQGLNYSEISRKYKVSPQAVRSSINYKYLHKLTK